MYTDFFELKKPPFNLTPDPSFLFLPPKHREALAGLSYIIQERKGFVILSGEAGTGNTTLINAVLSRLPAERLESSMLLNPTLTPAEFLESVLLDFDLPDIPEGKPQRLWKLGNFLSRMHQQGKLAVLVVDEAHKLSLEVLEEVRLLANFESAEHKLLQVLLVGQPELDDMLNREDLWQLKQRIAMRLYIDRLTPPEIEQYVDFRWTKAGSAQKAPFTADALAGIVQWSSGIPRLINAICDTALLMAYSEESALVGIDYVRAAAQNLALTGSMHRTAAAVLDSPKVVPMAVPANGTPKPNTSFLAHVADKYDVSS